MSTPGGPSSGELPPVIEPKTPTLKVGEVKPPEVQPLDEGRKKIVDFDKVAVEK